MRSNSSDEGSFSVAKLSKPSSYDCGGVDSASFVTSSPIRAGSLADVSAFGVSAFD